MSALTAYAGRAVLGLSLGFALSFIGFGSYDQVHAMFTFADLRLLFTFMLGVTLAAAGFFALRRARAFPARPFHRGIVPGALLFGAGWAICGACPGITLVQLGEGKALALVTIAGILAGNWAFGALNARLLRVDAQSCAE